MLLYHACDIRRTYMDILLQLKCPHAILRKPQMNPFIMDVVNTVFLENLFLG